MNILRLSLFMTVMLGMTVYFKKQVDAKKIKVTVPVKPTEVIMK